MSIRRGRALVGVGALLLAGGSAAFGYWTVNALSDTGSYAVAQASTLSTPTAPTATVNGGTAVTVGWTLPVGQLAAAGYQVTRTSPGNATVCTVASTITSCQDTGLTAGTGYTYSVAAVLDNWQSASASTSATTLGVTTTLLPTGDTNAAYSFTPSATGGSGSYSSWALAGTLPIGLTFHSTTGQISGIVTATGTTTGLILTVTDSNGAQASSGALSITFNSGPTVTTTSLATATDGQGGYSQTLTSTGGTGAITWSISSGSLPAGLALNGGTGVISGTVSLTATTQTFTVVATDAVNVASSGQSLTLNVNTVPAQPPVALRSAANFAVLAGSGITNTGATAITGDIGSSPTPSETGIGLVALTGTDHGGDPTTVAAKGDLATAYADAAGRTPSSPVAGLLSGTWLPGVYNTTSFDIPATLTLDAQGNTNAQFIFQAASTVTAEASSQVLLINGASPCNVVWQVGSSATFIVGSHFKGTVLAETSITAQTNATFQGRLLAIGAAVTMDTNNISNATCVAPTVTTASLATATNGQVGYSQTLASSGGTLPISWAVSSGVLPAGLTLSSSTGVISGTIGGTAVTQTFGVTATDANGLISIPKSLTLTVVAGAAASASITATPSSVTASATTGVQLSLQLKDQFGNNATAGIGGLTVTISTSSSKGFFATSSGVGGTLGGTQNVTFANGVGTGTAYYGDETAAVATVTVKNGGTTWGAATVTVSPKAADSGGSLTLGAATTTPTAGSGDNLTVSALDQFGNQDTNYAGNKSLTFAGASTIIGSIPTVSNTSGVATNLGTAETINFVNGQSTVQTGGKNGVMTLYKAEIANVTVSDGTINNGTGLPVTVTGGAANRLAWSSTSGGGSCTQAGTPFALTYTGCGLLASTTFKSKLTLTDTFGNPVNNATAGAISISATAASTGLFNGFTGGHVVGIPVGQSQSSTGGDGSVAGEVTYQTGIFSVLGSATVTATAPPFTTATASFTE